MTFGWEDSQVSGAEPHYKASVTLSRLQHRWSYDCASLGLSFIENCGKSLKYHFCFEHDQNCRDPMQAFIADQISCSTQLSMEF